MALKDTAQGLMEFIRKVDNADLHTKVLDLQKDVLDSIHEKAELQANEIRTLQEARDLAEKRFSIRIATGSSKRMAIRTDPIAQTAGTRMTSACACSMGIQGGRSAPVAERRARSGLKMRSRSRNAHVARGSDVKSTRIPPLRVCADEKMA